jgi:acyl phosphate:glycerol-3-phosphate acyltransferase
MTILYFLAAYLVGAFPTGYLLYRWTEKQDIRKTGSGNTGFTNMLRLKGWRLAVPVLLIDVAKGFLPPFLIFRLEGDLTLAAAAGLFAVVGHMFPVYIGFRGGKGVATAMGVFAALALGPAALCLLAFLILVASTRVVSLGSMIGVSLFPLINLILGGASATIIAGAAVAGLVVFKHRDNIGRLLRGEERRLGRTKPS